MANSSTNRLIVDNIFKPLVNVASKAVNTVLKPLAKKALKSGMLKISAGAEKSGDLIAKRLSQSLGTLSTKSETSTKGKPKVPKEEDFNTILNQLISGSGMKKRRKKNHR